MFGSSKSNRVRGCQPNNNSAGEVPVVVCGVDRYVNKIFDRRACSDPSRAFLRPFFKICTARSANPFEDGW